MGVFRDQPQVFLSMPSSVEGSRKLAEVIKAAVARQDAEAFDPHYDLKPGESFSEATQRAIRGAGAVIADISGRSSNVMFEVGIAMGLRKPTLLLTTRSEKPPLELSGYQVAVYSPDDLETVGKYVELWLRDAVRPGAGNATL